MKRFLKQLRYPDVQPDTMMDGGTAAELAHSHFVYTILKKK